MKAKKDENGVIMPVGREAAPAEGLPTLSEQRPKEDSFTAQTQRKDENSAKKQRKMPIGEEELAKAKTTLNKYLASKKMYDIRFKENYDFYNLLYTEDKGPQFKKNEDGDLVPELIPKKVGAQALNVIMNKHADAMDNYPEAICLPRAKDDEGTAQILSSVIPTLLERNQFQNTYSNAWTDKLVGGACCYAVKWDPDRENGLGDIAVDRVDILSLAWEPFVENIQDSANVFCMKLFDIDRVKEMYPQLEEVNTEQLGLEEYRTYDSESMTQGKAVIVDWYYKKNGMLHFCKWCGDKILASSENEPEKYPDGFYADGKYPFVIDPLFKLRNTPVGFSFIDIARSPQQFLDELKKDILSNIKVNSRPRNLVKEDAVVNKEDLSDLNVENIEVQNAGGDISNIIRPIETKDIAAGALNMYHALIDEIKETTGTNDASNGASAAGVTSGSAIAALQEAGGKISRDINKLGYFAFTEICNMMIERMRQFYNPARYFRIVGEDKQEQYVEFDNRGLARQEIEVDGVDEIFERLPVFDIVVKAQRSNPFTTAANNQMMMDMYRAGMFNPENAEASLIALEGMSFEGKDKIVRSIQKNQMLLQTVNDLTNKLQMSNAMLNMTAAQGVAEEAVPLPVHESVGAKI